MLFGVDLNSMRPETCAAIAQILPVFLVALIAERIVFRGRNRPNAVRVIAAITRVLIDLLIVLMLLVLTAYSLVGIEKGGLEGGEAKALWYMSGFTALFVVYRWVLLSTPLLELSRQVGQRAAERAVDSLADLAASLGGLWQTVLIPLARVLDVGLTVIGSVLTAGLTDGVFNIATRLAERVSARKSTRVDEAPSDPDDRTPKSGK